MADTRTNPNNPSQVPPNQAGGFPTGATGAGSEFYDFSAELPDYVSTAPDYVNGYNYEVPNAASLGVGQWEAPNIELPDYSQFGNFADYTGRIGEYADMATKSGLKQLQDLTFKPEYDVERERQASRGLVGSGVENQNLQNLLTSQQARAGEFATNIQNKAFEQQTAELQALRGLQFDKEKIQMQQGFEAAITSGDWEMAKNTHEDMVKLELEDLNQKNQQFDAEHDLDIARWKDDAAYREWDSKYKQKALEFDVLEGQYGMNLDEERLDLAEERDAWNAGALAGYTGDDLTRFVEDKLARPDNEGGSWGDVGKTMPNDHSGGGFSSYLKRNGLVTESFDQGTQTGTMSNGRTYKLNNDGTVTLN